MKVSEVSIMLVFKDKNKYNLYVEELRKAIENKSWRKYMENNKYMDIYFQTESEPDIPEHTSNPYYAEIPIDSVNSCNVPSYLKKIPSNWERVVNAVPYILENNCIPIEVIKLSNGEYYIENGKHRFYAHVLLGKEQIPVSVREHVDKDLLEESMLRYNIHFYNNGSKDIAYPERVEEFIIQYLNVEKRIVSIEKKTTEIGELISDIKKNLDYNALDILREKFCELDNMYYDLKTETNVLDNDFDRIKIKARSVEMKKLDDARYILSIEMDNGRNINTSGTCSSGNTTRASMCTFNILNHLGYQVDMNYISKHEEFKLEDKRDAHNLNFDIEIDKNVIENEIIPNLKNKIRYDKIKDIEDIHQDFLKLMDYLSSYKPFETPGTNFSCDSSSFIKTNHYNYYLVGAENNKDVDSIYLFRDMKIPFDNLTITFLGKITSGSDLYNKLK